MIRWVRPHWSALILPVALLGFLLLFSIVSARSGYWGFSLVFAVLAGWLTLALGAGVRVSPDGLLIRNAATQRSVHWQRIAGLAFGTTLDVVVHGGVRYPTMLVQTNFAPRKERMSRLCEALALGDAPALTLLDLEQLRAMGGPGLPDLTPELLRHERARLYRPAWWQYAVIAIWLVSLVALTTR